MRYSTPKRLYRLWDEIEFLGDTDYAAAARSRARSIARKTGREITVTGDPRNELVIYRARPCEETR